MIPQVASLDLDAMAPGVLHKRWLSIADDPLGLPHLVPVLVARGAEPGPCAGITAAVHGDEVNGIPAIHGLFAKLDLERLRGTVVGVPIANVEAFRMHTRGMRDGLDLNHVFPGRPEGNFAQVYAHRLMDRVVRHLDLLIDLHTASRGRANCLYVRADMTHAASARMAHLQRPQVILHNPASDGTLRGAARALGIPAITVEAGNPSTLQRELVKRTVVGLRAVLADHGLLPHRPIEPGDPPVLCARSSWLYTDDGGLLEVFPKVGAQVLADEPIAQLYDPFGDPLRTYVAPEAGVVIGRSVDPVAGAGERFVHLGVPATAADGLLELE